MELDTFTIIKLTFISQSNTYNIINKLMTFFKKISKLITMILLDFFLKITFIKNRELRQRSAWFKIY